MESNYRNREFEQFLKENADQHRMFPSENVWKNIHGTLHTRRKWYAAGLAALLFLTGTAVTLVMVNSPSGKRPVLSSTLDKEKKNTPSEEQLEKIKESIRPFKGKIATSSQPLFNDAPFKKDELPEQGIVVNMEGTNNNETVFVNRPSSKNKVDDRITEEQASIFTTINDNDFEITNPAISAEKEKTSTPTPVRPAYPLTIESVTNTYKSKRAANKTLWQFFVTPTVSYRRLTSNNDLSGVAMGNPIVTGSSNVNSAVIHKPDLGLQIGTSFHRPLTKALTLRGGVQFNINRYDIKAYSSTPEVATIRLNDPNGFNSVWAWTYYRNFNGYKANWLKNYYFSISAPIGLELKLTGNKKTNIGIAGTVQPTYILRDKAYLISTDYKNYAKVPSLMRHLNANAGFEAFVDYSNGKTRWQIGPQVKYQLLSSFKKEYPVKEHLFDFGVKIGVFLNDK